MPPNTVAPIAVIADDQNHTVPLPSTTYDAALEHSVITKIKAFATRGPIRSVPTITLLDSNGTSHRSSNTINLRWRYATGLQTFLEKFYIVDSLPGGQDAMLRKSIEVGPGASAIPQAHAIAFTKMRSRDDRAKEDQKAREKREKNSREVEKQKASVRAELERMKAAAANGAGAGAGGRTGR